MSEKTPNPVVPVTMLEQWEGPALLAPGVLFEETTPDILAAEVSLDFASWVSFTALQRATGNPAADAIKAKVIGVLTAWQRRQGRDKLDELKELVKREAKATARNGKLTEQDIDMRVDAFFDEIRG